MSSAKQNRPPLDCKKATPAELRDAFYERRPISGLDATAPHCSPHNDEVFPDYVIRNTPEGRHLFPGIENAACGTISTTQLREGGFLGEDGFFKAMHQGILLLGVGGGPLDEHSDRKSKLSCTELVFAHLNLFATSDNRKLYGPFLRYVNYEDNNGDNLLGCLNRTSPGLELTQDTSDALIKLQLGSFAQNLKKGFENAGTDKKKISEVYQGAFQFYRNEIEQRKMFLQGETEYFAEKRNIIPLVLKGHENGVLLEINSDHPLMNKVVFSKWPVSKKEKIAVLFIRKTNGQFALMPKSDSSEMGLFVRSRMREVTQVLRDMVSRKDKRYMLSQEEIMKDGAIDTVSELYYDEQMCIVSNGSKTDPDAPGLIGSILTVEDVIAAVQIATDIDYFEPAFEKGCVKGRCAGARCPLANMHLERCYEVRNQKTSTASTTSGITIGEAIEVKTNG
ncbi:MAG: hypothetical protein JWM20_197 [Patescibacteria group bacterium]|nr:hypothetical protein [Patescibacteria group bacterium]